MATCKYVFAVRIVLGMDFYHSRDGHVCTSTQAHTDSQLSDTEPAKSAASALLTRVSFLAGVPVTQASIVATIAVTSGTFTGPAINGLHNEDAWLLCLPV